jgi:hypothetical protein
MLTDAQRRQYEAEFTRRVSSARAVLQSFAGRALSRDQHDTLERIRTFLDQATNTKSRDLVTALQLARRADLLSQDLARAR